MEVEIRSFSKTSFVKFFAVLHFVLGLTAGVLMSIVSVMDAMAIPAEDSGITVSQALINGFLMITIAPVAYALFGALFGFFIAGIYNVSVKYMGGIRFSSK